MQTITGNYNPSICGTERNIKDDTKNFKRSIGGRVLCCEMNSSDAAVAQEIEGRSQKKSDAGVLGIAIVEHDMKEGNL